MPPGSCERSGHSGLDIEALVSPPRATERGGPLHPERGKTMIPLLLVLFATPAAVDQAAQSESFGTCQFWQDQASHQRPEPVNLYRIGVSHGFLFGFLGAQPLASGCPLPDTLVAPFEKGLVAIMTRPAVLMDALDAKCGDYRNRRLTLGDVGLVAILEMGGLEAIATDSIFEALRRGKSMHDAIKLAKPASARPPPDATRDRSGFAWEACTQCAAEHARSQLGGPRRAMPPNERMELACASPRPRGHDCSGRRVRIRAPAPAAHPRCSADMIGPRVYRARGNARNGEVSTIVGTMTKLNLFDAVLNRLAHAEHGAADVDRGVFFVADEYDGYTTQPGDGEFFSKCREALCCAVIATQTYESFVAKLKNEHVAARLIANLRTKIWLCAEDNYTARQAADLCGGIERRKVSRTRNETARRSAYSFLDGDVIGADPGSVGEGITVSLRREHLFTPRAFTSLKVNQAIVKAFDGVRVLEPWVVYLKPMHENPELSWFETTGLVAAISGPGVDGD